MMRVVSVALICLLALHLSCDRGGEEDSTSADDEASQEQEASQGEEAEPACSEEALEEAWEPGLMATKHGHLVIPKAMLEGCEGARDELGEVAEAMYTAAKYDRPQFLVKGIEHNAKAWYNACAGGIDAVEAMERAVPSERGRALWEECELDEHLPFALDDAVDNVSPHVLAMLVLIIGHGDPTVEPDTRLADFFEVVLTAEAPETPFADAPDSAALPADGSLPTTLGGVGLEQELEAGHRYWLARFGSLGGLVSVERSDADSTRVEQVRFCPFDDSPGLGELDTWLDEQLGDQVERSEGGQHGVLRVFKQDGRALSVMTDDLRRRESLDDERIAKRLEYIPGCVVLHKDGERVVSER
jgi:hypothetical protein